MRSVYIETTIPSYIVAERSTDIVVAAQQAITNEWWNTARQHYELVTSEAVLQEIRRGDPEIARRRFELIADLPILAVNDDVVTMARYYEEHLGMTGKARADLPHIAVTVSYEIDFLLTWNCRHLANGEVIRRLWTLNTEIARFTPIILTPNELMSTPEERP